MLNILVNYSHNISVTPALKMTYGLHIDQHNYSRYDENE